MEIDSQATTEWITYKGERVRVKYCQIDNTMYINCYTKSDELFNELRSTLKLDMSYKWDKQEKYWYGHSKMGQEFLETLGVE